MGSSFGSWLDGDDPGTSVVHGAIDTAFAVVGGKAVGYVGSKVGARILPKLASFLERASTPRGGGAYPKWNGFIIRYGKTLRPGTVIQRIGGETGKFTSPLGETPDSISLLSSNNGLLNRYLVTKPLRVTAGPAVPWQGKSGFGTQYLHAKRIEELLKLGMLRPHP